MPQLNGQTKPTKPTKPTQQRPARRARVPKRAIAQVIAEYALHGGKGREGKSQVEIGISAGMSDWSVSHILRAHGLTEDRKRTDLADDLDSLLRTVPPSQAVDTVLDLVDVRDKAMCEDFVYDIPKFHRAVKARAKKHEKQAKPNKPVTPPKPQFTERQAQALAVGEAVLTLMETLKSIQPK